PRGGPPREPIPWFLAKSRNEFGRICAALRTTIRPRARQATPEAMKAAATGPFGFVSVGVMADIVDAPSYATGAALVIRAPKRPAMPAATKARTKKSSAARRISLRRIS